MSAQVPPRRAERRPTPELLIDVRTPAEIDIAPDGATIAFSLHATVSERGVSVPSDLWMILSDGSHARLTEGEWADRSPVWSPGGSVIAFLSDRLTSGHRLPYTMELGAESALAATFRGSAEAVSWSRDGNRLLVLVADPGSFGLEWSAVAVRGAGREPDPDVRRSAEAWRRLYLVDLRSGAADEAGPVGRSVWEFDWNGEATVVALVSEASTGAGWSRSGGA